MKTLIKIAVRAMLAAALLAAGFAAGFPAGQRNGFSSGMEWAIVQADILAREAGMFMPVFIENEEFKVVLKQPRNLHRTAWKLSDRFSLSTGDAPALEQIDDAASKDDAEQRETEPQQGGVAPESSPNTTLATTAPEQPLPAEQPGVRTF